MSSNNPFEASMRLGVSLVCAVKNRVAPLQFTIPSFLQQSSIGEIILVDWDSDEPLWESLESFDIPGWPDRRVVFVRVENQPFWNIAKAVNVGASFVTRSMMLKTDADVALVDRLQLPSEGKSFRAGSWYKARNRNERCLSGTMFLATSDFFKVGGMDERFNEYGWEDDEFYLRLEAAGLKRCEFQRNKLFHLPHSDRQRMAHQSTGSKSTGKSIERGREAARARDTWSATSIHAIYETCEIDRAAKIVRIRETDPS